ncbi:MAG: DUF308 domain-containing protein [Eubacteriales bacterium]|nr:DUF308 domain-containing protein [Eubacteriales bacterium]
MKDWIGRFAWLLAGLFLMIMGFYFVLHPDATLISIALLLGVAILVSGTADLVVYFVQRRLYLASGWFLADGVIDVLIGLLFICNHWLAAAVLPYAFGVWAVVSGVIKCVGASIYRKAGMPFWGFPMVLGVVLTVFGVVTFFKPLVAAVAISVIVAVVLIAQGLMAFMRGIFEPVHK